ncbi:MAG: alkaline phosphatase family protein [Actinobacteria bacterium]|nr:alkaline phosphatase family protein [Actinomycetota bacterium]
MISRRRTGIIAVALVAAIAALAVVSLGFIRAAGSVPSFSEQACALPSSWLERTKRGYSPERSGQIAILPDQPAYLASGAGGWSHSGPWPYLQRVPVVFYGPGMIEAVGSVDRPITVADIAPTLARLMGGELTADGRPLDEVAPSGRAVLPRYRPKVIVTVVFDGGGWNALDQWPDDWPVLKRMMEDGTTYTNATVGSSPSVTPAIHTTLGTGSYPSRHGITGIPVRDEQGTVVDAFLKGESSRFMEVPALAERWDEVNDNRALVGMVGYEPWHLGMIGQGAERSGGDKDDAAWLDIETNEWITNEDHYTLPQALVETPGLQADIDRLDAADGRKDGGWKELKILEDPARTEETPAFIRYHTRAMLNVMRQEGYGDDAITDLMFTNYKQIDRLGHYFNMASWEVHDSVVATDQQLGVIEESLDRDVGRGKWVIVMTADHGQQPDAEAIDGYGIDPPEILEDINDRFGPITRAVWPTEVFLFEDVMERQGVTVREVADFLADYRLTDNTIRPDLRVAGAGEFDPQDRLFDMAIPSKVLPGIDCSASR